MNIAFVSSEGGHLGQMKIIFTPEVIGKNKAILVTETSSEDLSSKEEHFQNKYKAYFFRKDYLGANPFRYLTTFLRLREIFKIENIHIIVTNGAQISIPAVLAAKSLRIKSIFLDTIIRVKTPNWSAKACYLFSDEFLVQHHSMCERYGKNAIYAGGIL